MYAQPPQGVMSDSQSFGPGSSEKSRFSPSIRSLPSHSPAPSVSIPISSEGGEQQQQTQEHDARKNSPPNSDSKFSESLHPGGRSPPSLLNHQWETASYH